MASINGGIQLGFNTGTNNSCRNCGHGSHCGTRLTELAENAWGKRLGTIVICQSCSCDNCSTTLTYGGN